jgi:tetratricopeptide (TPR) repeat protein
MKNSVQLLFLVFLIFSSSCNTENENQNTRDLSTTIPELLQRPEKLLKGEEWDLAQNQYADALKKLRIGQDINKSYLRLAEIYMTEARVTGEHGHYYSAALEVLKKVIKKELNSTDTRFRALSHLASVQLSQHDFSSALHSAQEAIKINPYNAQIYGALTDAYVEMGDYENAVKSADKMISIRPDLRSYSRVSYLREIHGDINGSIEAMKMAANAGYPGYEQTAWTLLTLGDLLKTYGNTKEARYQYEIALQQRPDYPFAVAALADLQVNKGKNEEGELMLKKACEIIPEFGFYVQLAHLYSQTDRKKDVNILLKKIWRMLEDDVKSGHNMNLEYADLHLNLTKNYDKALTYAQQEYAKRPKNIDVNKMLAEIYLNKNEIQKARTHIDEATRTGSKDPDLLSTLASIISAEKAEKSIL